MRNKLKETSITSAPTSFSTEQAPPQDGGNPSRDSSRGRKRSFDDDEPEKSDDDNSEMDDAGHRRKRSRDSSYEEANATVSKPEDGQQPGSVKNADDLERKILSPKKKRSRDQLDKDETKAEDGAAKSEGKAVAAENGAPTEKTLAEGEPEKKRHRDTSQEGEKVSQPLPGRCGKGTGSILTYFVLARLLSQAHSPIPPLSPPLGHWVPQQQRRQKNRSPPPPHPHPPLPRQAWPPFLVQSSLPLAR